MSVKDESLKFAISAHVGQVRKSEPEKPEVMHSFSVGKILENFGFDENVVAAGYLHDVVEDTDYTLEDIEKNFGCDIKELVKADTEPDKSVSWEDRKKYTINTIKYLPLRCKALVCADKIDNLEDLMLFFKKTGKRDFSAFKRGEESQKWYYTSIYESLIYGLSGNYPIFERYKEVLDVVFEGKELFSVPDYAFKDCPCYLDELVKLHYKKFELRKLKGLVSLKKPFIVEFLGTPRTGKTTCMNNLYDFFRKADFKVENVEEFTTSKYYQKEFKPKFKDGYNQILLGVNYQLQEKLKSDLDIVLIDRSLNDRLVWNYRGFVNHKVNYNDYLYMKDKFSKIAKENIDLVIALYVDSKICVKRDYVSSLTLEERRFINTQNITEYNESLIALKEDFEKLGDVFYLDTTSISVKETNVKVANFVLDTLRDRYIKAFKEYYNVK